MKLGRKAEFLKTIERPKPQRKDKMINLSNNQAAYGKYKDYPDTYTLYEAFANEWKDWGCRGTDYVLPTRGAEEALRFIFSAFAEPGTKVLRADPVFGMIEYFEEINRVEALKIDYVGLVYKFNPQLFIKALEENYKEISLIYLASPDNPTGDMIDEDVIVNILNIAKKFGIPVILDFTYLRFCPIFNSRILNIKAYPNMIIVDSLSKSHGLAGLRVGAIIADRSIIDVVRRLRPINEVSSIAAKEAVKALNSDIVTKNMKHARKWQEKFAKAFRDDLVYIQSFGNFILLRFDDDKHIYFYHKLLKHNIRTRIEFIHPSMKNILRISIGNDRVMRKVLHLLQEKK